MIYNLVKLAEDSCTPPRVREFSFAKLRIPEFTPVNEDIRNEHNAVVAHLFNFSKGINIHNQGNPPPHPP